MPTCIKCGSTREELVAGILCVECFLKYKGLGHLPSQLTLTLCPRCMSFKYSGKWTPPPSSNIDTILQLLVQTVFKPNEYVEYYRVDNVALGKDQDRATVDISALLRGVKKEVLTHYTLRISINRQLCPNCFRRAAGSPSAIVQVRSYYKKLGAEDREIINKLFHELDPKINESILSVEEVREGININMLDHHTARLLATRLRQAVAASISESYTVTGRRPDGRRISRLTISVRLPFFKPGKIAVKNNRLVAIKSINRGYVLIERLGSSRLERLTAEEAWQELTPLDPSTISKVIIVAQEPGWIHVQKLEGDYRYLELPQRDTVIDNSLKVGDEAIMINIDKLFYILPKNFVEKL